MKKLYKFATVTELDIWVNVPFGDGMSASGKTDIVVIPKDVCSTDASSVAGTLRVE